MKICFLLFLLLVGCTDSIRAAEALVKSGYSEVETFGHDLFACSEDDNFATKFRAKNPQGITVTGVVCCGYFKGCTVRF